MSIRHPKGSLAVIKPQRERNMISMGTAVFHRIKEEMYLKGKKEGAEQERVPAIKALVTTMGETNRFGCFGPETLLPCAESRIDSWKDGKRGW